MASNIGTKARQLGSKLVEFGSAYEQGATQDLRIEVAENGQVHLTGAGPRPTRGEGLGTGVGPNMLVVGALLLGVILFAGRVG